MTAKQLAKQADKRIADAYYSKCSGIQINIMDICKVYARGRELIAQGADDSTLGAGILEYVNTIRHN